MPIINITWNPNNIYTPHDSSPYGGHPHINQIQWRNGNNNPMPTTAGLYVISEAANLLYAGKADNWRDRFKSRSDALRNLNVRSASLPGRAATLGSVNPVAQIDLAERWLIRILYIRDQGLANPILQNVEKTIPFDAPAGGLTINNLNTPPAYLNAQYVYAAGAQI